MGMTFYLKNIIGFFTTPIGVFILLLICALMLRKHRPQRARIALILAIATVLIFSNSSVAFWLTTSLEQRVRHFDLQTEEPNYILMLGAGTDSDLAHRPIQQLDAIAVNRLLHAVWLQKQFPKSQLVFTTGAGLSESIPQSQILKQAAIDIGADPARIIMTGSSLDSADELRTISRWVNNNQQKVAIVSSATHLPRALMLAEGHNLNALAAPTDYIGRINAWPIWSGFYLDYSSRALHEYVGILWLYLLSMARS